MYCPHVQKTFGLKKCGFKEPSRKNMNFSMTGFFYGNCLLACNVDADFSCGILRL